MSCAAPKCSSAVESRIRDWEQLGGDSECSDGRRFVAEMVTCPLALGAVLRSSRSRVTTRRQPTAAARSRPRAPRRRARAAYRGNRIGVIWAHTVSKRFKYVIELPGTVYDLTPTHVSSLCRLATRLRLRSRAGGHRPTTPWTHTHHFHGHTRTKLAHQNSEHTHGTRHDTKTVTAHARHIGACGISHHLMPVSIRPWTTAAELTLAVP